MVHWLWWRYDNLHQMRICSILPLLKSLHTNLRSEPEWEQPTVKDRRWDWTRVTVVTQVWVYSVTKSAHFHPRNEENYRNIKLIFLLTNLSCFISFPDSTILTQAKVPFILKEFCQNIGRVGSKEKFKKPKRKFP